MSPLGRDDWRKVRPLLKLRGETNEVQSIETELLMD